MLYGDYNALNRVGCEPDASRLKFILFVQLYTHLLLVVEPRPKAMTYLAEWTPTPKEVGQVT